MAREHPYRGALSSHPVRSVVERMKVRYVRSGDTLDDDDEVVRGGELDSDVLRADARRLFTVYGLYGVSVFALRAVTLDELAQQPPLVRFPHLVILRVGTIRTAGLALEATGRNPRHFTVVMADLERGVEFLSSCERRLWENPYHEP